MLNIQATYIGVWPRSYTYLAIYTLTLSNFLIELQALPRTPRTALTKNNQGHFKTAELRQKKTLTK